MRVITRSGNEEPMMFDKIVERLNKFSVGLNDTVDTTVITQKVIQRIYDRIKTSELDELTIEYCLQNSINHPDFSKLASRIAIDNHHKDTDSDYKKVVEELWNNNDVHNEHAPLVSEELYNYVIKNSVELQNIIDYERDFLLDCFGFKTLQKAYLLKKNGVILERPQHLFMRVAIGIHCGDIDRIKQTYELMSQKYFIHATPTLFHAGTPFPQLSSCFLMGMEDSVKGMYKTISDCAVISKYAGGIGVWAHDIRSNGSYIRSTGGTSAGLLSLLQVFNSTCRHINQSGRRNGSFAIYLEPHHPDILTFLDAKKPQGAENERARDLFYAMWISDLFMKRVEANAEWSLMDPDECPGLSDVYGDKFEALYTKYETEGRQRSKIPARDIWNKIISSQIESGVPYMLYKDACNKKSNQQNVGTIKSSNLCTEIIEYSDSKEYAVCNLASISLPMFVKNDEEVGTAYFDFEHFRSVIKVMTYNLNRVIDKNFYPLPETERSNMRHRPIGLGVQGLADTYVLMDYTFDGDQAKKLNKEIFENLYYAALESSNDIASKDGPYESWEGSPAQKGKLQFDLWNVSPITELPWDDLKERIKKTGLRNSLLVAPMPTASTSQILGNNECIEPYTSNLYLRRTLAGEFLVVNKYLMDKLMKLGLWNQDMKNKLMYYKGSVKNIMEIPEHIRNLFKTTWEIKQKVIIDQSVDRGPYICQSQSLNIHLENPTFNTLSSMHLYGWKKGLKTGSYYIRGKPASSIQNFTIDPKIEAKLREEMLKSQDDECVMCSA